MLFCYLVSLCRGNNLNIFCRSKADERKSLFKHPYQHRRSRKSTPDLFTPYPPGPELTLPSPMSVDQTMPVYSVSRSCSNLSSACFFVTGSSIFMDSVAPFDLSLAPSSSGLLYTNPGVVEDLSIRSTTCSVFPSQMPGPVFHTQLLFLLVPQFPLVEIPFLVSRHSIKILNFQNYPLDTFSGKLFDIASSTTFVTSDTQAELHCAITRLYMFSFDIYKF